jgi:Fe-S cluster assembly protein SufD
MSAATAIASNPNLERYRTLFESRFAADALSTQRRESLAQFLAAGFPTPRDEAWKYTNLRRLEARAFALAEAAPVALDLAQQQQPWIANAGMRVVFVNGRWMPSLSSTFAQPPGATVVTLGKWLKHAPTEVIDYLAATSPKSTSAFEHLNAAFFEDGVAINLAPGATLDEPVHVVHLWTHSPQPQMSHPKIIVRADRDSRFTLIEQYAGVTDVENFTNAAVSIELEAGAKMEHYRLQEESQRGFHIAHIHACVREHARYEIHDLAIGAALSRLNLSVRLAGSGAHATLKGLFMPSGAQHIDAHTLIEHLAPHTTSEEEYRGIAEGRGRGVFNGKVFVHQGAQKTDARQSSRNLLLSSTAEIDTKPELEIYANDVKCSHGATTGQLDPTALFYLRSRGIPEMEARALLIRAFAESILSSIRSAAVNRYLESRLAERFGAKAQS